MVTASEEGTESEEAVSLKAEEEPVLPEVISGENYLRINEDIQCFTDEDIQCFNDEVILEDDIVEAVSNKWLCQSEDGSEGKDGDPNEVVAKTTHAAARRSVQKLQRYFIKQGVSNAYHAAIDVCGQSLSKSKFQNEADYSRFVYVECIMNLCICNTYVSITRA